MAGAVRETTGASVPAGVVGSCTGAAQSSALISIEQGQTLEEALSETVGRFGNTIWVAAETAAGQCSLGLLQQSVTPGTVCIVTVTNDMTKR